MDSTLALAAPSYAPPALAWHGETAQAEEIVWWAVFVGFAYSLALIYATYCRSTGGSADISLSWKGFKVACYR